jgi:predicted amino acid racemase
MMLDWLEDKAIALDCEVMALDSGVQRQRAHRFYFREGMHVSSFCFRKILK